MKLEGIITAGRFRERLNRFLALVDIAGVTHKVHVPTSGRMGEMLIPGSRVLVREVKGQKRTTGYELVIGFDGDTCVSIDSRLPNKLVHEALENGSIEEFRSYRTIKAESVRGDSRMDFLLTGNEGQCLIEVKSVTLVVDGVALFPDAPTLRGTKHLKELTRARREGLEAAVVFVIQRGDALSFSPNRDTDPAFADVLDEASNSGVRIIALQCFVDASEVRLDGRVPVNLA